MTRRAGEAEADLARVQAAKSTYHQEWKACHAELNALRAGMGKLLHVRVGDD